jgi:hypothetical protein
MARRSFTLILLAFAGVVATAGTTTLYRTVDQNGVVQYSDRPTAGAEKISVAGAPNTGSGGTGSAATTYASARPAAGPGALGSTACEIGEPKAEQVYFDTQTVAVHVHVVPEPRGDVSTSLTFDGTQIDGAGTSFTLNPVFRGAHSVTAVVHDPSGGVACQTPSVTFYMRDASLLQPNHTSGAPLAPSAPSVPLAPGVPHN